MLRYVGFFVLLGAMALASNDPGGPIVAGARSCLGDRYDSAYYSGGPPPKGRGACTDVLYAAFLRVHLNLQDAVAIDMANVSYPSHRDRNIDYRWAPNLLLWFQRHTRALPLDGGWVPGDAVFWTWSPDGVADHCGIISDRRSVDGRPLVIHNLGPVCAENDALYNWKVIGHFRYAEGGPAPVDNKQP